MIKISSRDIQSYIHPSIIEKRKREREKMGQWIKNPILDDYDSILKSDYDLKAMGKKDNYFNHFLIFRDDEKQYRFYGHQSTYKSKYYKDKDKDFYYNKEYDCLAIIPKDINSNLILAKTYEALANNKTKDKDTIVL